MSIQGISSGNPLPRVAEAVGVKMISSAISNMKQQGQDLLKLLNSAVITDPALGNRVNMLV
ncbi:MAG: putative motility protein [Treponema sp.]|nr:putative motility protein [Treponema sp.]